MTSEEKNLIKGINYSDFDSDLKQNIKTQEKPSNGENMNSEKHDALLSKLNDDRQKITTEFLELNKRRRNIEHLSEVIIELNGMRQRLLEKRFQLQSLISTNDKKYKNSKKSAFENLHNQNLLLKSKADKDIFIDSNISNIELTTQLLTHQSVFITDVIKAIDIILYNVKTSIELEKFINPIL